MVAMKGLPPEHFFFSLKNLVNSLELDEQSGLSLLEKIKKFVGEAGEAKTEPEDG